MEKPTDLASRGSLLWDAITAGGDLDDMQFEVLVQACRTADRCDALAPAAAVDPSGPEAKQELVASQQLARLLTALRLPDEHGRRPQVRGVRGAQAPSKVGSSALDRLRAV